MVRHDRPAAPRPRLLTTLVALLTVGASTFALARPSAADVGEVTGSAFGYSVANVVIFGGAQPSRGPEPTATLERNASNSPQRASAPSALVRFGPATLFSSAQLTVSSEGSLGPGGSVRSSAEIQSVNTSGQELFTASRVQSSCEASESGVSGSTTVTGGNVQTSEGNPDAEGDEVVGAVSQNPSPNTAVEGTIEGVGDGFRYVFNEQVRSGNGITVNAVHLYMLGPTATGEVIIGQSRCSVSAGAAGAAQPASRQTPTTRPQGSGAATTTTTAATGGGGGQTGGGSSGTGDNMPNTGADILPLAILATAFVIAGAIVVVEDPGRLVTAARRRRRR
ncbi:MAG TPA: hypothetical protein VHF24_03940 [Acidimicrobiales bacterium]|nr:hypothetical protein [Acidimicrobiales bacterium]